MALVRAVVALAYAVRGCVLHGTDSGVCDFRLDPEWSDPKNGWSLRDTAAYRHYHIPKCQRYVKYAACVPEMERINETGPDSQVYQYKGRIEPDIEHPRGRFFNHTIRNKDAWVFEKTEQIIDERLGNESSAIAGKLADAKTNHFGEGTCEGADAERCSEYPACAGGPHSGCVGFPIEPRMTANQDCQKAFEAYFCYINFPRCYWDDTTKEMKSVALCRTACKNFFKVCGYDKSLWRCGRTDFFNGNLPERLEDYGKRVVRRSYFFFPRAAGSTRRRAGTCGTSSPASPSATPTSRAATGTSTAGARRAPPAPPAPRGSRGPYGSPSSPPRPSSSDREPGRPSRAGD